MATDVQLDYCKKCKNQKVSIKHGIICRLTNQPADFDVSCAFYVEDIELLSRLKKIHISTSQNASTAKRFANFLLDGIFYYIFCAIIGALLGIIIVYFDLSFIRTLYLNNEAILKVVSVFLMFVYYFVSEALTGRTLAKLITRTKVINNNGSVPSLKEIALRSLCRFIPFDALSFFSDDNLGWHDRLSKTKVVDI
jgi:uncharacterized RDD family membrane protein YckC